MARVIDDCKSISGKWLKSKSIDGATHFTVSGQKWRAMMDRCKEGGSQQITNESYVGCTVSENFKDFDYFTNWCLSQVGYSTDYELDKDLLTKGNKLYSEHTCLFLPKELNNILLRNYNLRGELPIGVVYRKDNCTFRYQLNIGDSRIKSGAYSTAGDAFNAYKTAKESFIKQQANKWKDQIDPRAYEALMNYQVEITD